MICVTAYMSFSWVMYGHSWSNRAYPTSSLVNKELCCHSWCVCVKTKEAWDQKFKTWTYSLRTNLLFCFKHWWPVVFHIPMQYFHMTLLAQVVACGFSGFSGLALAASAAAAEARTTGVVDDTLGIWCFWITIEPQKHPQLFDAVEFEKSSTQWVWPTLIPWTVHL